MNELRLVELLCKIESLTIMVVGDYFLDTYLVIDRNLSETSLETGLEAYQVIDLSTSPGAAGNVAANQAALGSKVLALGVIGKDGNGFELKRSLSTLGVDTTSLIEADDFFTPTYTKPMMVEQDGRRHEIQRLDIKNRTPLSSDQEDGILNQLVDTFPDIDGLVIVDQVDESDCGVITRRVRGEIINMAKTHPHKIVVVDSRHRIGYFKHAILKPNAREAVLAFHPDYIGDISASLALECGKCLCQQSGNTVFLTMGSEGMMVINKDRCQKVPAFPPEGEIDIVGAGDTCIAALTAALCAGADDSEAALIGNLAASVTIRKIGTTGTASADELVEQYRWYQRSE